MTETSATNGQATADSSGTTVTAPGGSNGTSGSTAQTTGSGPVADAIEAFFDPASIAGKPELESAYKQMQGSYTKRMQDIAKHRPKIEAYDSFEKDPVGTMTKLAQQFGYQLVQKGQDTPVDQDFKSWDDVEKHFFDKFQKQALNPVIAEVRALKQQSVEQQLDSKFPDWRTYETDMMDLLRRHPTFVNDPDTLYRMSVPAEILEARATKAAMQKLKGATDNAQVSGGNTTTKQTTTAPTGPLSFNQAVEFARAKLQQAGVKRPAG